jgi:hypothetical protein
MINFAFWTTGSVKVFLPSPLVAGTFQICGTYWRNDGSRIY